MEVLLRPRLARAMSTGQRDRVLSLVRDAAVRFEPAVRITDCRDAKDNIYLELALAAGAATIVSSDMDLLVLHPWRGVRILLPSAYLAIHSEP
jgi:putative PIN family toxin of toxin-antitoxin system